MKKLYCLLLVSLMLLMCACGNTGASDQATVAEKEETPTTQNTVPPTTQPMETIGINADAYYGTWDIAAVNIQGSLFTIDEVKAMGDESLNGVRVVIKEGGKAYLSEPQGNLLTDWEYTEGEFIFNGNASAEIIDGQLHLNAPNGELIFDKTSLSQTITGDNTEKEETKETEESEVSAELSPEFKKAMDDYEAFYDEYYEFMTKYKENPTDPKLLTKSIEMLEKVNDMEENFSEWGNKDLNDAELQYYLEVTNRILEKTSDLI